MSLAGKVAFITGATRGIGREVALAFASQGCSVVITGKTAEPTPNLPGTVFSVADEVEAAGGKALPIVLDVRDAGRVAEAVDAAAREFNRGPDIMLCNSGAMWWRSVLDTPIDRYDLMMEVNVRGAYAATRACLPYMIEQGWGHIIMQSPPMDVGMGFLGGRTAYAISKLGMTMTALGVSQEMAQAGHNVAANTIWPVTLIESTAVINNRVGRPEMWRKPSIVVDAIMSMVSETPAEFRGQQLLDEPYLRSKGVKDFAQYQCVPGKEPPTMEQLESMLSQ